MNRAANRFIHGFLVLPLLFAAKSAIGSFLHRQAQSNSAHPSRKKLDEQFLGLEMFDSIILEM